jgi:6-phosphogluconolactonase
LAFNTALSDLSDSSILPVSPGGKIPELGLPGREVVRSTLDELLDAAAADLYLQALACVRQFGDFHLALSGGSTPEPLYRRLMTDPAVRELPWRKTHLWIVDERRVPLDDPMSNYRLIHETIIAQSDIPPEQVHPIPATHERADVVYEDELRRVLEWRERGHDRLDYVLLGVGADGHTASLFPHSPALSAHDRLVVMNDGPTVVPPPRVTMTHKFINAARFVGVLVTGAKKREIVAELAGRCKAGLKREDAVARPILGVRPKAGELRWYLDREACPI